MQKREENLAAPTNGNNLQPLAGVTVTVTNNATGLPASLYLDDEVTPITSLVTSNTGYYAYKAADGEYTETFSSPRFPSFTRQVVLDDPQENPPATLAQLASPSGATLVNYGDRPVADKLAEHPSIDDFSGASAGAKLQAAIDYLAANGGGKVTLPAGAINIGTTITVSTSNILIEGAGGGASHDVGGQGDASATILNWTGAAGGTMIRFASPTGASAQKQRGGGVTGAHFRANGAGIGLDIQSWNGARFDDLYFEEFATAGLNAGCVATLGEAADTQQNEFTRIICRQITVSGAGIVLGGIAGANTSMNTFKNVDVFFKNGNGIVFNNCDNNYLERARCYQASGTGFPVVFNGSSTAADQVARANVLIGFSSNGTVQAKGTTSFTHPSHNNTFQLADMDNSTPYPVIEAGSSVWWNDTTGVDYSLAVVKLALGESRASTIAARTAQTNETLYLRNGSNNHARFSDGTNLWGVSIDSGTGKFRITRIAGSGALALQSDVEVSLDLSLTSAGRGLRVKEGSNAKQGIATLSAGTVTVANTSITASSRVFLTAQDDSTTGALRVSARTAGTSFAITSSNAGDSGVVAYEIFEPA